MKKIIFYTLLIFGLCYGSFLSFSNAESKQNIVNDARFQRLVNNLRVKNVVYNPDNLRINPKTSIADNIRNIFFPSAIGGGIIYNYIRNIGIGVFVLFLMLNGMFMVWYADSEKEIDKAKMNFLYIGFGAFLIFGSGWLLSFLKLGANQDGIGDIVTNVQNTILFQILSFLKAAAFFVAIVLIVYHGIQIIRAYEKEDKLKEAKSGIINVIASLVFIKVIDYIFYIATQKSFKTQAIALIVATSKALGRVIGGISILYVIYAGFQLITSGGDEAKYKSAINTLRSVLLVGITIMLFLLITYQLFTDVFK